MLIANNQDPCPKALPLSPPHIRSPTQPVLSCIAFSLCHRLGIEAISTSSCEAGRADVDRSLIRPKHTRSQPFPGPCSSGFHHLNIALRPILPMLSQYSNIVFFVGSAGRIQKEDLDPHSVSHESASSWNNLQRLRFSTRSSLLPFTLVRNVCLVSGRKRAASTVLPRQCSSARQLFVLVSVSQTAERNSDPFTRTSTITPTSIGLESAKDGPQRESICKCR